MLLQRKVNKNYLGIIIAYLLSTILSLANCCRITIFLAQQEIETSFLIISIKLKQNYTAI
jgi:hypothetical protein